MRAVRPPIEFPIVKEMLLASVASLPSSIQVAPGCVIVDFPKDNPVKACELLYYRGLALANDFASSERLMDVC
jgi:hypothetical protein